MKRWGPIVALVLVLAAVVGGGYLIDLYIQRGIEVGLALERARVAEAKVAEIDAEIAARDAVIRARDEAIEASKKAAAEREAWFQKQLAGLQQATPTQLVDTGSAILGAGDIVLSADQKWVTMSVETYKKVVFRLVEHREYVNVREPAWNAREALYKAQISDLKLTISDHERKDILNAGIIKDLKTVISKTRTMSIAEKAAWAAGGFVAGSLASKLL